jgi:hypothetical protein
MGNIIEYIENNMHYLSEKSFNAVDSLVLSKLSYVDFKGLVKGIGDRAKPVRIKDLLKAEMFNSMFRIMREMENNKMFICALASSPRFRDIKMNYYVNNMDPVTEKQFSAVTYLLDDKTAYIAFRGTDASLIGWKEDFNMAFLSPVPSQQDGVNYLNTVARLMPRAMKLRVGGHSKGGNIAVYSSINCNAAVQKRILNVYNHDGPGFKENLFESDGFKRIKDRINTTLPESSLVGMLLQYHADYSVVKSSRRGIMQHEPYSWVVEGDDFSYIENVRSAAMFRNRMLNQWLDSMTDEKRKLLVDALFQVIEKTENEDFNQLFKDWHTGITAILNAMKNIDADSKKFIYQTASELIRLSFSNLKRRKAAETSG